MMGRKALIIGLVALVAALSAGPASAATPAGSPGGPRWQLTIAPEPTILKSGDENAIYLVTATNVGGATAPVLDPETGVQTPITITTELPAGLEFQSGSLQSLNASGGSSVFSNCSAVGQAVTCEAEVPIEPGQQLFALVFVKVTAAEGSELTGQAEVTGGGAPSVAAEATLPVNGGSAAAGIVGGSFYQTVSTSQAGAHPNATGGFSLTSRRFAEPGSSEEFYEPSGSLRSVHLETPPGLIGSAKATPTCDYSQFLTSSCPVDSQVGIESLSLNTTGGARQVGRAPYFNGTTRLYNLTPRAGAPAEFGFQIFTISVLIKAQLRTDGDYGLTLEVSPASEGGSVFSSSTMFYGTPAKFNGGGSSPTPLVYAPTSCEGPQQTKLSLGFYQTPEEADALSAPIEWGGCDLVPFQPTFAAAPTTATSDSPTGLGVDVHLPQDQSGEGLASSDLRDATVTLPAGVAINPSAATGLAACTPAQFGLTSAIGAPVRTDAAPASCPDASKIGTVEIDSPLLEDPIPGGIYVAQERQNPFGGLLGIYLAAYDPQRGVVVKLAGNVQADPSTGRLTATFTDNPQLPFEDIKLDFFGGPRAALRTPATCGKGQTVARLTPWSGTAAIERATAFDVTTGATGSCASSEAGLPNSPSFEAGTVDPSAGTYSPFLLTFGRAAGTQLPGSLTATLPPGLLAKLAGVPYCSDATLASISGDEGTGAAQAASPSCPAASQIGTVSVAAGAGPTPFRLEGGRAYLAGPYKGAPLSLAIVTPAVAGPFDLGSVVVRTALRVDPATTRITAVSDPLPQILHGIPLDLREVRVNLDRNQFAINPTGCAPSQVEGSLTSTTGAAAAVATKFRAVDCGELAFAPRLSLKVIGKPNRGAKPRLRAVLTRRPSESNIARARINLPHSEFLEQANIKTVCTRVQFNAGAGHGAGCPKQSIYGHARAISPLLDAPLEGPVYLRSSSHKLPDLVAALNGQIDVELDGRIDAGPNGGIRNTFEAVPDAPVSKFVLQLFGGKRGLLVNSENLCARGAQRRAIARFTGQNGTVFQSRPIVASSCKHS